jgi:hypothetical protein
MHVINRRSNYADVIQVTGIDIFNRPSSELDEFCIDEFYKARWNLNISLEEAPDEYWLDAKNFNLVNSRFLMDGINTSRLESYFIECNKLLKPGGLLQAAEVQWTFHSRSRQALPNLTAWTTAYTDALTRMQKDPAVAKDLERLVRWAGCAHVVQKVHDIPVRSPRRGTYLIHCDSERPHTNQSAEGDDNDEEDRVLDYVDGILESFALIPFTQTLHWSMERCMQVVQAAQAELRAPSAEIYFQL